MGPDRGDRSERAVDRRRYEARGPGPIEVAEPSWLWPDIAVEEWVERFLDRPGIEAVALGHRAAARSYQLHHLEHRDPADRLLIATAIELGCPLVTYDGRIQRFGRRHGRKYGFAVAS